VHEEKFGHLECQLREDKFRLERLGRFHGGEYKDVQSCLLGYTHFTRQYIPEDNSEHHTRRRENLKSHEYKDASLMGVITHCQLGEKRLCGIFN
jgi:hypothetical protein